MRSKKLIIIILLALLFRLGLVPVAYHGDLNNNISWGNLAVERGFKDFYEGKTWPYSAPNQPPLTVLLFSLTSFTYQMIDNLSWNLNNSLRFFPSKFIWFWENQGMTFLVKIPSIIADLGIGLLIYNYFKKRNKKKTGLGLLVFWLFNPIVWYNSSIWGQTDSIVNLLGLAAVLFLIERKSIGFAIFMTLSLLFKGSLAIFLPIILVYVIWQKFSFKEWLRAIFASAITICLVSVWFHPGVDLFVWLINLYSTRILPGEIGYLTANAFNFWWLVSPGKILDSTVYFGLSARIWGYLISLGIIIALTIWLKKRKFEEKYLFLAFAITAITTFLFMTRIHERYLYPLFPMATIVLGFFPTAIVPLVILSVVNLLNLYYLFWAPSFAFLENLLKIDQTKNILSIINLLVWAASLGALKRFKS